MKREEMSEFQAAIILKAIMKCPVCHAEFDATFRGFTDQRFVIISEGFLSMKQAMQIKIEKFFKGNKMECKKCKAIALLELKWTEDDEDENEP